MKKKNNEGGWKEKINSEHETVQKAAVSSLLQTILTYHEQHKQNSNYLENPQANNLHYQTFLDLSLSSQYGIVSEASIYGLVYLWDSKFITTEEALQRLKENTTTTPSSSLWLFLSASFFFTDVLYQQKGELSVNIIHHLLVSRPSFILPFLSQLTLPLSYYSYDTTETYHHFVNNYRFTLDGKWEGKYKEVLRYLFSSSSSLTHRLLLLSKLITLIKQLYTIPAIANQLHNFLMEVMEDYTSLHSSLSPSPSPDDDLFLIQFLTELLPLFEYYYENKIHSVSNLKRFSSFLIRHLLRLFYRSSSSPSSSSLQSSLIDLAHLIVLFRQTLRDYYQGEEEEEKEEGEVNEILLESSFLLLGRLETEQKMLLEIIESYLIDKRERVWGNPFAKLFVLPYCMFPLIQIVASSKTIKEEARKILTIIQHILLSPSSPSSPSHQYHLFQQHIKRSPLGLLISTGIQYLLLLYQTPSQLPSSLIDWFHSIIQTISSSPKSISQLTIYLIAPMIMHGMEDVRKEGSKVVGAIGKSSSKHGMSLLPLLLYQLERETKAEVQLELLYSIPSLSSASSHFILPILKILLPLVNQRSMKPIAIRLLYQLWLIHDRSFIKLIEVLNTYDQHLKKEATDYEIRLAISSTVRDVCKERSNKGMELLPLLSKIIKDPQEAISSQAIQTFYYLCKDDILSFEAIWKEFTSSGLVKDGRPAVIGNLLFFLSSGISKCTIKDSNGVKVIHEELYTTIIHFIWANTSHPSSTVRSSAYSTLRLYTQSYFDLVLQLHPPSSFLPFLFDHSSSSLLSGGGVDGGEGQRLVVTLLQEETSNMRRNIETTLSSNPAYLLLGKNHVYLDHLYKEASLQTAYGGIAMATLYSFQLPPPKKQIKSKGGEAVMKAREYKKIFNDLLSDVNRHSSSAHWMIKSIAFPGWILFSSQLLQSLLSSEKYRLKHSSTPSSHATDHEEADDEDDVLFDIHNENENLEIVDVVVKQLVKELKERSVESPAIQENCILALSSICLALPKRCGDTIEYLADYIEDLFNQASNEWESHASALSLGIIAHSLHSTDISRFLHIKQLLTDKLESSLGGSDLPLYFSCSLSLGLLSSHYPHMQSSSLHSNVIKGKEEEELISLDEEEISNQHHQQKMIEHLLDVGISQIKCTDKRSVQKYWLFGSYIGLSYSICNVHDLSFLRTLRHRIIDPIISYHSHSAQKDASENLLIAANILTLPSLIVQLFKYDVITNSDVRLVFDVLFSLVGADFTFHSSEIISQSSNKGSRRGSTAEAVEITTRIALGGMVQGVMSLGFPINSDLLHRIAHHYLNLITSDEDSVEKREAAMMGLGNMLGANLITPILSSDSSSSLSSLLTSFQTLSPALNTEVELPWVNDYLVSLKSILERDDSPSRLSSFAAVMIGSLSRPLPHLTYSISTSLQLNQLPENSILKALLLHFTQLSSSLSSSLSSPSSDTSDKLTSLLTAMSLISNKKRLPSINWSLYIQMILKSDELGVEVQEAAVKFAVSNLHNFSIADLLSKLTEKTHLMTLSLPIRRLLFSALPHLLQSFATSRSLQLIREYTSLIHHHLLHSFHCDEERVTLYHFLHALHSCFPSSSSSSSSDPSFTYAKTIISELQETILILFRSLPSVITYHNDDTDNHEEGREDHTKISHSVLQFIFSFSQAIGNLDQLIISQLIDLSSVNNSKKEINIILLTSFLVYHSILPMKTMIKIRSWFFSQSPSPLLLSLLPFISLPITHILLHTPVDYQAWVKDSFDAIPLCSSPLTATYLLSYLLLPPLFPDLSSIVIPQIVISTTSSSSSPTLPSSSPTLQHLPIAVEEFKDLLLLCIRKLMDDPNFSYSFPPFLQFLSHHNIL